MSIRDTFCPRCGRPSEGVCETCAGLVQPWVQIEPRIIIAHCPVCGATREQGGWMILPGERQDLVDRAIRSAVIYRPEVQQAQLSFSCRDWSSNRTRCQVQVEALYRGQPVQDSREVEVLWKGELCTRCSRMSGGYYEGVVQVRATGRALSPREMDIAITAAEGIENSLREGGDPLSFISRIEEVHQGLDIVVGTQAMGRMIGQEILNRLGGSLSTHPKLVGERNGIPVYRVTYAVRLSRYQRGDVVEYGGRYREVRESSPKQVTVYDLQSGEVRTTRPDAEWRKVGNVHDAQNALVAYVERDIWGLIDPRSGVTREVRAVHWLEVKPGNTIRVLPDDERDMLVLVG
jgi:nonsense-mediated mRNA decay protein 3